MADVQGLMSFQKELIDIQARCRTIMWELENNQMLGAVATPMDDVDTKFLDIIRCIQDKIEGK